MRRGRGADMVGAESGGKSNDGTAEERRTKEAMNIAKAESKRIEHISALGKRKVGKN